MSEHCSTIPTVYLADTQALAAEGLKSLCQANGLIFLGRTDSLPDVDFMVDGARPQVLIMDQALGGIAILDWLRSTQANNRGSSAIVWGTPLGGPQSLQYLKCGALGAIDKRSSLSLLEHCIKAAIRGERWLESLRNDRYHTWYQGELSKREHQVIDFIIDGLTTKEIASVLGIARNTAKIHIRNIYKKTGANSRSELVFGFLKNKPARPSVEPLREEYVEVVLRARTSTAKPAAF